MQQISDEAYEAYLKERGLARDQYTTMELLAVAAAREVPDGAFVFAGTGLPLLASMLAQFTVAPNMTLIMEAGIVGPKVEHLPISVSDPRGCLKGSMVSNMADTFGTTALRGYVAGPITLPRLPTRYWSSWYRRSAASRSMSST